MFDLKSEACGTDLKTVRFNELIFTQVTSFAALDTTIRAIAGGGNCFLTNFEGARISLRVLVFLYAGMMDLGGTTDRVRLYKLAEQLSLSTIS